MCVKLLQSRLEAIQKLKPPTTIKGCRSLAGMVNFVSIFCPDLQKLLKPIYDLMRKGRQSIWGKEQQVAFDEIKKHCKNLQFYTSQIIREDFIYIQTLANLPQAVCYIKFKMVSQN